MAIVGHLRAAAALLPAGGDLELFEAYLAEGMFEHAFQALREAAAATDVPFGFWVEMSKAGDALGMR
jgi:hypothetical protein